MNNMPNVDTEHTHYACQEQVEKYGEKTECCSCTGHYCPKMIEGETTLYISNEQPHDGDISPDGKASVRLLADE